MLSLATNNQHPILSQEQQQALNLMHAGHNIFLSGEAGTGKSVIIHEFRRTSGKNIAFLAPTGMAALNIGGVTVHSFLGLTTGINTGKEQTITAERRDIILNTDVIIIDEVSMVRADVFQSVDNILRKVMPQERQHLPFGGIQVICVGDFLQLPPVVADCTVYDYLNHIYGGIYAFNTPAWRAACFAKIMLKKIFRQSNRMDKQILNAIRTGNYYEEWEVPIRSGLFNNEIITYWPQAIDHLELLNKQCYESGSMPNCQPICLCTTRKRAEAINKGALDFLNGPETIFHGKRYGRFPEDRQPTETLLRIRIGMRVMLLVNQYARGMLEFANGTIGTVVGYNLSAEEVQVELQNGRKVLVKPNIWETYEYLLEENEDGELKLKQEVVGQFRQIPLVPAYAMTIHKSQGQTLDSIQVELGSGCFASGQLYTALSRCRSLSNLYLSRPVSPDDVIVDEKVLRFYNQY